MCEDEPLNPSQVILYQTEDNRTRIEVRLEGGNVWLTQAHLADLYQTTPQNITLHVAAIYEEGELAEAATCKDYLQVRQEGQRQVERRLKHYNLDMVLAIGYRVRSHRGTQFRRWATERLREYLVKGFTLDDERLTKETQSHRHPVSGLRRTPGDGTAPHAHARLDRQARRLPSRWRS